MHDFSQAMVKILDKNTADTNFSGAGIGRLLDGYESLVKETEEEGGLDDQDVFYKFDNDLYVRQLLDKIINDPEITQYDELQSIIARVKALDDRMMLTPKASHFAEVGRSLSLHFY